MSKEGGSEKRWEKFVGMDASPVITYSLFSWLRLLRFVRFVRLRVLTLESGLSQ